MPSLLKTAFIASTLAGTDAFAPISRPSVPVLPRPRSDMFQRRGETARMGAMLREVPAPPDDFELDAAKRLDSLSQMPAHRRARALGELSADERKAMLSGRPEALDTVHRIADRYRWTKLKPGDGSLSKDRALGYALLADRTYHTEDGELDAASVAKLFGGLIAAGWIVNRVGRGYLEPRPVVARRGRDVMVAIRGTADNGDTLRDLDCLPIAADGGKAHAGFEKSARDLLPKVREAIDAARRETDEPVRVALTGHSLGGAVATTLAPKLDAMEGVEVSEVYTYGAPMAHDRAAARRYDERFGDRTYAFVNDNDGVPEVSRVAVPLAGYQSVGQPVHLDGDGELRPEAMVRSRPLWQRAWSAMSDVFRLGKDAAPVADHSSRAYIKALYVNQG